MPKYGVAQAGDNATLGLNLTSLIPGEAITLFDGTETAANGLTSVAFARGYSPSPGATASGITYIITGMPSGMTVDVQVANKDVDADYTSITTLSPGSDNNAAFTDNGSSAFCRLKISAYTSGAMCVGIAQR